MAAKTTFDLTEILHCGSALRQFGADASSIEEVAGTIVTHLRDCFVDKLTGRPILPLVRFYVTSRWADLEPVLKDFALAVGTDARTGSDLTCLALLASAGEEAAWNDRRHSVRHRAIPLPSIEALRRLPMVARLVEQLGVDPYHLVDPNPVSVAEQTERAFNVFHVEEARDSPYVPDQANFVLPYGIRSVIGLGGGLTNGELFAVLLFSAVPVPATTLDAFSALALSMKLALLPHAGGPVFADKAPRPDGRSSKGATAILGAMNTTMAQLLDVRAAAFEQEAGRLELEARNATLRSLEFEASAAALRLSDARKQAILDGALDCIIGMDSLGRITEFNPAAETMFDLRRQDVLGQTLAEMIIPPNMRPRHREGLAAFLETGEGPVVGRRIEVQAVRADGQEFPVELAVTEVAGADPPLFTGYLRDISDRHRAAEELARGRERLAHIARTLQTSLLPPELPRIEGFELAAAFRALGDGYEVGGDFYDAFEVNDGRWAVTLGDVCGKGSEAAVVTALTRYTIRAAAMRTRDPAAVLRTLNEAVHRQHPDQFVTAVYATLDPTSGILRLASGGHPAPLLLTARGDVTPVGMGGQLLGPFEDWQVPTVTVTLAPGDLLLLYSDGVTEARSGGAFFGEERLVAALRGAAGLPAQEVTRRVEAAVADFAPVLTDDLAILAIGSLGQS